MILDNSTFSNSGHMIPTSVRGHRRIVRIEGKIYAREMMLTCVELQVGLILKGI